MAEENQDTQKTNVFKQLYEYIKENIAPIALLINVVGFVNYFIYYKSFGIPIFNYVGLNDLIFFVLEYVLSIVLVIVVFDFAIFIFILFFQSICEKIILSKRKNLKFLYENYREAEDRIDEVFYKRFKKLLIDAKQFFPLLCLFVAFFYPLKQFTMPAFAIYALCIFDLYEEKVKGYILFIIIAGILLFSMLLFTMNEAIDKRDEKQDYTISFVENNQLITTEKGESTLNYIGESSIAIFLYDIEQKEARVFIKSNLSDIRIQLD